VPRERINNLRTLLQGGQGAPTYAPHGLLRLRRMSVEQLAQKSGLTRTAIYNYMARADRPTAQSLHRICEALDLTFDQGLEYCTPAPLGRPPWEAPEVSRPVRDRSNRNETTASDSSSVNLPFTEPQNEERPDGLFARELQRLMTEHEPPVSIRAFSSSLGLFTYEHARKLCRSLTLPSKSLTLAIAQFFEVSSDALYLLVKKDQLTRDYGEQLASEFDPDLAFIASSWPSLSDVQKKSLLSQLELFISGGPDRQHSDDARRMPGGA
jgi:transcriptional regulator with XRE-family HTH domain